jgi:hypothetical protein
MEERIRLGKEPLSLAAQCVWKDKTDAFANKLKDVNRKVSKLNLVTPTIQQQMMPFSEKCVQREIRTVQESYCVKAERGDLDTEPAPKPRQYQYYVPQFQVKRKK